MSSFQDRYEAVKAEISRACSRAGRNGADVVLVAVSKTFPPESVEEARSCGATVFGENRVQEALAKAALCGSAEWHLIGPLQRNKIRRALSLFTVIHSIDSIPILEAVSAMQEETGARPGILLEINVAGEASKHGFKPEEAASAVRRALELGNIELRGFMTVPPWTPEPESSRKYFAALRELRDSVEKVCGVCLPDLSMGMSCDYPVAIEEGATFVRVGTALFGHRAKRISREFSPDTDSFAERSLDTDDFV